MNNDIIAFLMNLQLESITTSLVMGFNGSKEEGKRKPTFFFSLFVFEGFFFFFRTTEHFKSIRLFVSD